MLRYSGTVINVMAMFFLCQFWRRKQTYFVVNLPFDIQDDTDDRLMVVNVHLALAANDIMVSRPHCYITEK